MKPICIKRNPTTMKRTSLLFLIAAIACIAAQAQSRSYSGAISIGKSNLNISFNIKAQADGKKRCTMDIPEQGAKNIPVSLVKDDADSLSISIAPLKATYKGRKMSGENIVGTFTQNDIALPLNLKAGQIELNRPQTPVAPFNYTTEEVLFCNEAEGVELSGTLTYPVNYNGETTTPIVLMVTGSGSQGRDETIYGHKPFHVIADYLAQNGIASLRYDDRGVGKSKGSAKGITTMNNLADAKAGIAHIRNLYKFGKIGVLGHSEGGTIAFMMAADKSADFIVSLAGGAANGIDVIVGQNRAIMQQQEGTKEYADHYATALRIVYKDRVKGKSIEDKTAYIEALCTKNKLSLPNSLKANLEKCITYGDEWFTWFLSYNPRKAIRKTTCPVMALNGSLDMQILSKDNLPIIEKNLRKGNKNRIKEYEGLNHMFQHCTQVTALSYGAIEETISPEVLDDIAKWINSIK